MKLERSTKCLKHFPLISDQPSPQVGNSVVPVGGFEVVGMIVEGPGMQFFGLAWWQEIPGHLNIPSFPHETTHREEPKI